MICVGCGAESPKGMTFCGGCGAPLRNICPACRAENPPAFGFCGTCGTALAAGGAPRGDAPDNAECRQLTVMFCDLAESTALAERLAPEAFREVVREYHAAGAEAIGRFGGHVAQYLGDGLLVYFGYPRALGEDAQHAVHSALGILRAVHELNERLERERGVQLGVRIGVHTGPVVAGRVGSGARSEQLAMGHTPNVAARLQALAPPGTVIISADTHALVRGFFACESLGAQTLRGFSQPVEAFRVVRDTGVRSRFELAVAKGLTPSVDRQRELTAIFEAFERVRAGGGQVVWVVGEAGIGKSRLLQMFQDRAAAHTPFWVLCRCTAYSQHSALHPVIELFERLFDFEADDPFEERRRKLEVALARYGPLEPNAVPLLCALLSLPLAEDVAPLNLAPERQRDRTLQVLLAILLRIAQEQPVVLGIEDLHWADPSTLEFLGRVMEKGPTARIMMLLTHRPVFMPSWSGRTPATHLRLDRLADEHVRLMVEYIAAGRPLPEEVHRYILEKTDGVPIFIEELTRAVLDSRWLVGSEEGYALSRPLQTLTIPVTLQDLLLARLDRLGHAKDVALLASVLGREFTYEMIHAVSRAEETRLRGDLNQLADGGLLYQLGEPPAATYMFKHVLIQDAAYALLLKSTRQQHHRRVAETLAQRFPETAETRPELLAHHFTEAGLAETAVGYWLRAGRRAVERSANVEASRHAREGLALLEQVAESPARDAFELGLQNTLGSATIALRGYGAEPVEKAFARALELCQRLDNAHQRFRAELGLWTYYVVRADYDRAIELADELHSIASAEQGAGALVQAAYCRGFSRYYVGQLKAAHDAFAEGAAVACRDGDPTLTLPTGDDVRIHLLAFLGLVLWHLGRRAEAIARCEEALTLAHRLSHPYGVAFAADAGAFLGVYSGDVERANAGAAETMSLAIDKGYRYFVLLSDFIHGWALARAAGADKGLITMERSIKALRAAGAQMGQTFMMLCLADGLVRNSRFAEARAQLLEVRTTVKATGECFFEPELHRLLGACDVAVQAPGAEQHFSRALDQARARGDRALELQAATSLATLLGEDAARRAEARTLLAAALAPFAAAPESPHVRAARALLACFT
jgi:class 3 adenylate cyclase/tetratricopeptide (TPR) repeat protein